MLPAAMKLAKAAPILAPLAGETALGAGLSAAYSPEDRGKAAMFGGAGGAAGYGLTRALGKVAGKQNLSEIEKAKLKFNELIPEEKRNFVENINSYIPSFMEKERTSAEFFGPKTERMLGALGRKAGTTEDELYLILSQRKAERTQRLVNDFSKETGVDPSVAYGDLENFIQIKKDKASPLYEQALNQGTAYTDRLNNFISDPDVKDAFKAAVNAARRKSLETGEQINWRDYAITNFNSAGDPIIGEIPTWKTWDLVKKGLDRKINSGKSIDPVTRKTSFTDEAKDLIGVKNSLVKELDNYAEASGNVFWKQARKEAGDYLEAKEAFDKGTKFLTSGSINEKQFADALKKYEGSSLEAFKGGVANDIFNKAQNNKLSAKTLMTPRIKEKLNLLFGENAANNLIKKLEIENDMARFESKRMPGMGSPTEEYRQATQEVSSGIDYAKAAELAIDAKTMGLAGLANKYVGRPLIKSLAGFQTKGLSQEAQNELGRMLMLSPEKLALELKNVSIKTKNQRIKDALRNAAPYVGVGGGLSGYEFSK